MIIKRVNIWSIEPIFCSNFNYIPSSKTVKTKNNKSVLFLGGKVCVSLGQSTDTRAQQFLGTEQVSSANSNSPKFNLVRKLSDPGGTIGKKLQNNQLLFLDLHLCTSYLFVNQTNDSPDRNCSYCVIC